MKSLFAAAALLILSCSFIVYVPVSWGVNVYRLIQCDWEESYKGEVIYGLGLFTPTFLFTAWMDLDS